MDFINVKKMLVIISITAGVTGLVANCLYGFTKLEKSNMTQVWQLLDITLLIFEVTSLSTIAHWNSRFSFPIWIAVIEFISSLAYTFGQFFPYDVPLSISCSVILFTVCPLLLWKFFIFDPLNEGIILNEPAQIMNEHIGTRDWEGVWLTEPITVL
jgi:hypothetical protein